MSSSTITPASHRWQVEQPRKKPHRVLSPRAWILFVVLGGSTALAGLVGGLLTWHVGVPNPHFVPLFVTQYRSIQIPDNLAALHDRRALLEGGYFTQTSGIGLAAEDRRLLLAELARLPYVASDEDLVIYVCAYAGIDAQGAVFLMPGSYDLVDNSGGIPLAKLLKVIHDCPAQHKLVVLDVCWPLADARLGILNNDISGHIQKELDAVEDSSRLVLCPCSPGQVSLVFEDLGRSLFGYHFDQGLRGLADGYNSDQHRDGRVSVRELAAFVRARVDRWAWTAFHERQTPWLLGSGENFDLVALPHGKVRAAPATPPVLTYPPWLKQGWQLRDQLKSQGWSYLIPREYTRLQKALLRAEGDWVLGAETAEPYLRGQMALVQNSQTLAGNALPRPPPHSLALARMQGATASSELNTQVGDLLLKVRNVAQGQKPAEASTARTKLIQDFLTSIKDRPDLDLAFAVWAQALEDPAPSQDRLQLLNDLLQQRQPQRMEVETRLLQRLASRSASQNAASWPAVTAGLALQVTDRGERAATEPAGMARLHPFLITASQQRHLGQILFEATGYAQLSDAEKALRQANESFETVLALQEVLHDARHELNRALFLLPDYVGYLEYVATQDDDWRATVLATRSLAKELFLKYISARILPDELRQEAQEVQRLGSLLTSRSQVIRQPFASPMASELAAKARREDANGSTYRSILALLSCALLTTEDRVSLRQAGLDLARRLRLQAEALVVRVLNLGRAAPRLELADSMAVIHIQRERAWARGRRSVMLLQLAGLSPEYLQPLEAEMARGLANPENSPPNKLQSLLMQAWSRELPAQLEQTQVLLQQGWIGRLLPTYGTVELPGSIAQNPSLQFQVQEQRQVLKWLAEDYRYRARDGEDEAFYLAAVADYITEGGLPPESYIAFDQNSSSASTSLGQGPVEYQLSWSLQGGMFNKAKFSTQIFNPDPQALQIVPQQTLTQGLQGSLPMEILWKPEPGAVARAPLGFLVGVSAGERAFHQRVPLPSLPGASPVELVLGTTPASLGAWPPDIRLRPVAGTQAYHLGVRNLTDKALTVMVDLSPGARPVKVTLGPGQTSPVPYEGAAPKPGTDLPELTTPLQIRVLDATGATELLKKELAVAVAHPLEYVGIAGALFQPGSLVKNRLEVKLLARRPLAPPPCQASLALSANTLPGFLGIKASSLQGMVPADAQQPLVLFAQDIQLAPTVADQGSVDINVDECQRAFVLEGTFSRTGSVPVQLQLALRPRLRLQGATSGVPGKPYPVRVLADSAPVGSTLEVTLGRPQGDQLLPDRQETFSTPRQRRVGFQAGSAAGALLFQAALRDWDVSFDTTGLVGVYTLRARLQTSSGLTIASATQQVTLDGSPPEGVAITSVTASSTQGKILVQAIGQDSLSGIGSVLFWVGKPMDGKIPPNTATVPGQTAGPLQTLWSAELPQPPATPTKSPFDVSVRFISNAGLHTDATISVDPASLLPPTTGTITGTVLEGPRPQAGLQVTLMAATATTDTTAATAPRTGEPAKGGEVAKTTTAADGTFTFKNVKPGAYTLETTKPASGRKGEAPATVEAGKVTTVSIPLSI